MPLGPRGPQSGGRGGEGRGGKGREGEGRGGEGWRSGEAEDSVSHFYIIN